MNTPAGESSRPRWAVRTNFGEEPHALACAIAEARRAGRPPIDLTVSNPTKCDLPYDTAAILEPLASEKGLVYDADPLGVPQARAAIARQYYEQRHVAVDPERILLTSSTSEAYGYLLRLLCDPDDEILVPQPSYPLFDLLARFHDVRLVPYPLLRHDDWRIDFAALRAAVTGRTKAIVLVHPNNPTGHAVEDAERAALETFAREFGLALIVDEVFLDFPVETRKPLRSFAAAPSSVLTFVLSGLSKVLALPQMKLAWTVVHGPGDLCAEAMYRLELIADTFLSPNAPVQHAVRSWLSLATAMQSEIERRVRENLAVLDTAVGHDGLCSRLPVVAGWAVVVRVPAILTDEVLALHLLERHGTIVHPGSFYGFPASGWLVLSLLGPPSEFQRGVARIVNALHQLVKGESLASIL